MKLKSKVKKIIIFFFFSLRLNDLDESTVKVDDDKKDIDI